MFQTYLKKYNRENSVVFIIKQYEEPEAFTSKFPSWDADLWGGLENYDSIKEKLKEKNNEIEDDE